MNSTIIIKTIIVDKFKLFKRLSIYDLYLIKLSQFIVFLFYKAIRLN